MSNHPRRGFKDRIRALPSLLARAPTWTVVLAGTAITVLGGLIVTRPLTSLVLLGIYIGISCMISGAADLSGRHEATPRYDTASALVWIFAGLAILIWLGRSIELLPIFVAILLIASGALRLARLFRPADGDASTRALSASFGAAEFAFGIFALTWPDLTLIVVAVLFGVRTIAFGLSLLWRGGRSWLGRTVGTRQVSTASGSTARWRGAGTGARWVAAAAVLSLAAGTLVVSHALRSGTPVVDGFYSAPATIPSERESWCAPSRTPGSFPKAWPHGASSIRRRT